MSQRSERACALYAEGHNCAQALLLAFCEDYGLSPATAEALACSLGGGAKCGELCGAAAAMALIVGLKYGAQGREPCTTETKRMMAAFEQEMGAMRCADLLADLPPAATPELLAARKRRCSGFIGRAALLLEQAGY